MHHSLETARIRFGGSLRCIAFSALILLATPAASQAQAQIAQTATVSLTDGGFQPTSVTIPVGGTVTWTINGSFGPRSVVDPGGAFDSGPLNPGQTFTHTFPAAGNYNYSSFFDCHDDNGTWRTMNGSFNCQAVVNVTSVAALPSPAPTVPAVAQAPTPCQYVLGFKTLHDLDPADVGDCVDSEYSLPGGDENQHTTKGLLAWRKADNWTAFTNGYQTWINGPKGLAKRLNTQRFTWEANPDHLPIAV